MNGVRYTKRMRKTHTILIPEMMEYHFNLIAAAFVASNYPTEVLDYRNEDIADTGLRYCHNDICYPCVLIVGQLISALKHRRYDPDRVAFLIPQTGGACRAGNYFYIIRHALDEAGFHQVPVISLNLSGKEKQPGFRLSLGLIKKLVEAALYGDFLQAVYLKKVHTPECRELFLSWEKRLMVAIVKGGDFKKNLQKILEDFSALPDSSSQLRVGIVGEIYVKCCRLGNRELEKTIEEMNATSMTIGFTTYCLYVADTSIADYRRRNERRVPASLHRLIMRRLIREQKKISVPLKEAGYFFPEYTEIKEKSDLLPETCITADGWLVSAESSVLAEAGYDIVLLAMPFGCMVSHVCSKGVLSKLRKKYPNAVFYPLEYDASLPEITVRNRIFLAIQSKDTQM